MALSDFNISPMTGSGSNFATQVVVSPKQARTSAGDLQANLSVNGGGSAHPLTIIQYGIPIARRVDSGSTISSVGGVATYVVETHYDFFFEGIPDWITLSDKGGNIPLSGGTTGTISATTATNNEYYFNVQPNPSASSRTTGYDVLNFRNYRRDNSLERMFHTGIKIDQEAGSPSADYINVDTPVIVFDWDAYSSGNGVSVNIYSNVSWTAASNSLDFEIVGSNTGTNDGTIVIAPTADHYYTANADKHGVVSITDGSINVNISITQYREPYEELLNNDSVNPSGDTKRFTITSDYAFWYKAGSSIDGNNGYSTTYITMYYDGNAVQPAPIAEADKYSAVPSGRTFDFVWLYNDAVPKNDLFIIQYRGVDGVVREMRKNFYRLHQDYVPQHEDYVIVSPSALTLDWFETGNTNYLHVETYSQSWSYEVQGDTSDFEFEKIGSQLKITPKNTNTTRSKRELTFTFSAGTSTATTTATATQYRKPILDGDEYGKTIPRTGGTRQFYVVSDYDWWIVDGFGTGYPAYSPSVGSSSNPNSPTTGTSITATFSANTSGADVPAIGTAYIRVYYKDLSNTTRTNGGASTGWKQLGGDDVLVANQNHSFGNISSGGSSGYYELYVNCDTAPWGITLNPATASTWVHISPTTGDASSVSTTCNIVVDANSGVSRSAIISVSAGTATPALFSISQQAAYVPPEVGYVSIIPTTLNVGSGASVQNPFAVSANTTWTITENSDWLKWNDSASVHGSINGGTGSKTIYAIVSENSGNTPRIATTIFSSATNSVSVDITQDEGHPAPSGYLEIDPAQISPASSSYDVYEVEYDNGLNEDYSVVYSASWAKFYDGPEPSMSSVINTIEANDSGRMWLEVSSGHHGNMTITFTAARSGDQFVFLVQQP